MKTLRPYLFVLSLVLSGTPYLAAQQETPEPSELPKVVKSKAFEIGTSNLFEALRQMAAYRKLDLVIDPEVPNRKGLYAFKHTTWEKALATLMTSNGLAWEIRDGILHVGQGSRAQSDQPHFAGDRGQASRIISITFRPSAEGEALLSVNVSRATRAEIMEALSKLERIAKAKPDRHSFNASWVLKPMKDNPHDELETFSMEDVTPSGLRSLYP